MSSKETGSLERWLKARGAVFSNANGGRRAVTVQLSVAGVCIAGSLCFLAMPLFGVDKNVMLGSLGPGIAGITNVAVGLALRRRLATMRPVTVPLSPEAKEVLTALNRKYLGRAHPWAWNQDYWQEQKAMARGSAQWGWGMNLPQPMDLSDEVLDYLERAAFQYNRVTAILATTGTGVALAKMADKVSMGADECMAEILHQSGLLGRYPEAADAVRLRLAGAIGELTELADRVQSLATSEPTFTERLTSRSSLQDVLDELRVEQAARTELGEVRDQQRSC